MRGREVLGEEALARRRVEAGLRAALYDFYEACSASRESGKERF
jgi:hypothetical protein